MYIYLKFLTQKKNLGSVDLLFTGELIVMSTTQTRCEGDIRICSLSRDTLFTNEKQA